MKKLIYKRAICGSPPYSGGSPPALFSEDPQEVIIERWTRNAYGFWAIILPLSGQTVEYIYINALSILVAVTDINRNVIERSEYEPYGALLNRPLSDWARLYQACYGRCDRA